MVHKFLQKKIIGNRFAQYVSLYVVDSTMKTKTSEILARNIRNKGHKRHKKMNE